MIDETRRATILERKDYYMKKGEYYKAIDFQTIAEDYRQMAHIIDELMRELPQESSTENKIEESNQ